MGAGCANWRGEPWVGHTSPRPWSRVATWRAFETPSTSILATTASGVFHAPNSTPSMHWASFTMQAASAPSPTPRTVKQLGRVTARLADAGLAGIEVYAEKYGPDEQAGYRSIARQNGLVECGGSDYHAFGYPNEVTPGLYGPPPDTAELLFGRARAMHGNKACRVPSGLP